MNIKEKNRVLLLNLLMSAFHWALMMITFLVGNVSLLVSTYDTKLTFYNNPDGGFELVPEYKRGVSLNLTYATGLFFFISSFFHIGNCALWKEYYITKLENCQCPTRFIEYFFSAPVMILSISYASGVRSRLELMYIYVLVATTMLFGWLTELLFLKSKDGWVFPLSIRLQPHIFGYFPQLAAWYGVLEMFLTNALDGCGPPEFVYYIVIGELILFFSFGVPQLYQLLNPPEKYIYGEYMYQGLSLLAKGFLGIIILVNALMYDTFDATASRNETC